MDRLKRNVAACRAAGFRVAADDVGRRQRRPAPAEPDPVRHRQDRPVARPGRRPVRDLAGRRRLAPGARPALGRLGHRRRDRDARAAPGRPPARDQRRPGLPPGPAELDRGPAQARCRHGRPGRAARPGQLAPGPRPIRSRARRRPVELTAQPRRGFAVPGDRRQHSAVHSRLVRALALAALIIGSAACSPAVPTAPASSSPPSLGPIGGDGLPSIGPSVGPSATPITCARQLRVGLVAQPGSLTDNGYNQSAAAGLAAAAAASPSCFETDGVATKTVGRRGGRHQGLRRRRLRRRDRRRPAARRFPGRLGRPEPGHEVHRRRRRTRSDPRLDLVGERREPVLRRGRAGLSRRGTGRAAQHQAQRGRRRRPAPRARRSRAPSRASSTAPQRRCRARRSSSPTPIRSTDPAQGGAAATAMIAKGADVIFSTGSATGDGALLAACKAGVLAIGSDTDQSLSLPKAAPCVVSSAMKNVAGRPDRCPPAHRRRLVHARLPDR